MTDELYPYQAEGVEFLRAHPRAFLCDEMGLGKSAQLIRASQGRTLVVAPAALIDTGTWAGEVNRWADDPDRFTLTAYSRLWDPKQKGVHLRSEFAQAWDTVIFDEAHYLKNPKAKRTRAAMLLSPRADRLYLASGTPVSNWAHELFVPLQLLNPTDAKPGGALGSYWRWVETWFKVTGSPFSPNAKLIGRLIGCDASCSRRGADDPCEHYRRFSALNLGDKFKRRLRDEVLTDLPELQHEVVPVPMRPRQWAEYRRMKNEYLAQVDDQEVIAWSGAARHLSMDRICTSLGGLNDDPLTDSGKLDRLAEDLEQRTRPTVVVGHYRTTLQGCAQVARKLGKTVEVIDGTTPAMDRKDFVHRFQAGKLDVLVGSFETISEGLTLTAADCMILVEISYKAARNTQVVRRIHRIGQQSSCLVLEYQSTGPKGQPTLDTHKRALVDAKTADQARVMSAATIKEIL